MELPDLKLDAIEFSSAPTEDEVIKTIQDIELFLTKVSGVLFAAGKYSVMDQSQKMQKLFGALVAMKGAREAFQGISNIAQPQLMPQRMPLQ